MNTQFAELIEQRKNLVALREKELADAKLELEETIKASELCNAAEAAQRKIEEGQRELEKAIAQMPPDVAAIWQQPKPDQNNTTEPSTDTRSSAPPVNPPKSTQKEISEKDVDKAIAYISQKKHQTNKTGLLRIKQPILEKAATKLGVQVVDSPTKKDIAEAIAQTLDRLRSQHGEYVRPTETPFKPGDLVQTQQGDVGEVAECQKKDGDGSSASDSTASEPTTSSGILPTNSEPTNMETNTDSPGNGAATIPGDMPNLVIG